MKNIFVGLITVLLVSYGSLLNAQSISPADQKVLTLKQDSLQRFSDSMINSIYTGRRFLADSNFVRTLVRSLKVRNSFYFPFDSLQTISRLYAPDTSFRIFTWQLKKDDYMYIQKGAIQMRTADGSLKLYPLFDASMFTAKPQDSVRNKNNWIGAIYYKIIQKEYNGKKYYTLLGFDDYSSASNRKWMEVLSFADNGEPVFGGPLITFKDDTSKVKPVLDRFGIEYKKEASTSFNYNPEMDMIIYDHLISETEEPQRKESYVPDGDFEGFKWEKGQWIHVDQVFNFKLKDGEFPQESNLLDPNGKLDEKKLIEQSEKNMQKSKKKQENP